MTQNTQGGLTAEQVRAAGGIVHSDGNVFFTSLTQLNAALRSIRHKFLWELAYSEFWELAGPIIHRENIMLSPPTSRVHRHGGPNAGWGSSGLWGATMFEKGVTGRRPIAHHETSPLIAAMRCYVEFELGKTVEVPAALLSATPPQQAEGGGE